MAPANRKPSDERPPDVEIGAVARVHRIRFHRAPETRVEFSGRSVAESESGSKRHNLPARVEPGVTYRDARIGWRAAAWIENAADTPSEKDTSERRKR